MKILLNTSYDNDDSAATLDDATRAHITAMFQAIAPEYDPKQSYYPKQGADECDYEKA